MGLSVTNECWTSSVYVVKFGVSYQIYNKAKHVEDF